MKAQREIDSVTGRNRLPTIADMANLPYVKSLIIESMRFNPPAPLGAPLPSSSRNDVNELVQGCLITKSRKMSTTATISRNALSLQIYGMSRRRLQRASHSEGDNRHMCHDPEEFSEPMLFNPDRYEGRSEEMQKVTDIVFGQFCKYLFPKVDFRSGFGRRICVGQHLAMETMFAMFATLLATCVISPLVDAKGHQILPSIQFTSGVIS
jgi:hypothetical protein